MGYPDSFKIVVSDTQAYRQFGNSVVVPVVAEIAAAVCKTLTRPVDQVPDFELVSEVIVRTKTIKRTSKVR
jgi:DNA (cytosine-5)-methyltransferase 1